MENEKQFFHWDKENSVPSSGFVGISKQPKMFLKCGAKISNENLFTNVGQISFVHTKALSLHYTFVLDYKHIMQEQYMA